MRKKTSFNRNSRNLMKSYQLFGQKIFEPADDIVKDNSIFFESTLFDICLNSINNLKNRFVALRKLFISSKAQAYRKIMVPNKKNY